LLDEKFFEESGMARIAEGELARLKREVSLVRLIEDGGVELMRQGKDLAARCPFHEEDTASLIVTPEKNLFHCFGCGAAGGPIDWVMKRNGVSFRHAVELLRAGVSAITESTVKRSTVRALPPPVAFDADDQALLNQVAGYYHETLKQSPDALAYLEARGLVHGELVERFRLGYANRTLGLRLPEKNRKEGAEIRARLTRLGIIRETGHEHFNGSLVVPVMDAAGNVAGMYGRKIRDDLRVGTPKHLYLPGPHSGVWNADGLAASKEVILCEAVIDAMTFWCAGYRNVTATYGTNGFTEDHLAAFRAAGIERVLIAFDRDPAGDRAAAELAEQLRWEGFGCWRILFPKGMDANDYALKVTPATKSLGVLIRKAEWLGDGVAPARQPAEAVPIGIESDAPEEPPIPLAAKKDVLEALPAAAVPPAPALEIEAETAGEEIVLRFDCRRWRVRGMAKNLAVGVLKVNVMVAAGDAFHVDTLDLYAARHRAVFVQQASAELRVREEILKAELGRVLLKLEEIQDQSLRQALEPKTPARPDMSDEERAAALELLRSPDVIALILGDFEACGVVGETTNKLTAYLAATSRKLDAPLAVVVQSSSAAGKTALMDAVLAFMPPEETVRYSAMTGQSLFYMGETDLKHRILAIAEEQGAARAAYALKLLQSEGELTIASTGSDANGNLVTREYRVEGPTGLFMTTTAIDVDEELMNRCLVLSVDEGREQTRAIHRRQRERRTLDGLAARERRQAVQDLHRNVQRLLRPLAVVNPYADRLTFLDDRIRARRDHEKYLGLIDTLALLHQHQRPVKTLALGERRVEYVEATADDIAIANRLAHEVLGRSLDELPPQTRKLLAELVPLVRGWAEAERCQVRELRFTRRRLRDALGWGDTQLKLHLSRLAELELLLIHRQTGGGFAYELVYDGDGGAVPHLSGLIDPASLSYDGSRSGLAATRPAPGRGVVGLRPGAGRTDGLPADRGPVWGSADADETMLESHPFPVNGAAARSYKRVAAPR
jgi:DNA primase